MQKLILSCLPQGKADQAGISRAGCLNLLYTGAKKLLPFQGAKKQPPEGGCFFARYSSRMRKPPRPRDAAIFYRLYSHFWHCLSVFSLSSR